MCFQVVPPVGGNTESSPSQLRCVPRAAAFRMGRLSLQGRPELPDSLAGSQARMWVSRWEGRVAVIFEGCVLGGCEQKRVAVEPR